MPFTDSIKMVDVIISSKHSLNALPADVVAGKQFIGQRNVVESGTLATNPVRSDTLIVAGESFNIPTGINPVSYNVIAKGLEEQTPATATPNDILDGKTAWVNGEKITGTIGTSGSEVAELLCGQTHQISRGFHDGSGYVKARSLTEQTIANIVPEHILKNDTCWANGEMIVGTMPSIGKVTITLYPGNTYTIPEGSHSEQGKVSVPSLASLTPGNATEYEIVSGYAAWVNGVRVYGGMANNPDEEILLPMNGTYNIPNGYHSGMGKVTQNIPSKEGQTVAPAKDAQTIPVSGYYMEGDIVVTGVDGLKFQTLGIAVKDSSGINISNYPLNVISHECKIPIYIDNWHDNATYNIYKLVFTNLVDANGNNISLECDITFDGSTNTVSFGDIIISIGLENNAQYLKITGITSGLLSMNDSMDMREF